MPTFPFLKGFDLHSDLYWTYRLSRIKTARFHPSKGSTFIRTGQRRPDRGRCNIRSFPSLKGFDLHSDFQMTEEQRKDYHRMYKFPSLKGFDLHSDIAMR
jgi:hypothetical protein